MAVTLSIRSTDEGAGAAQTLTFDQPRVVIGRGAHADVRLPARAVSSTHCALRLEGGELTIVDDGSTNGTLVNASPLVRGRKRPLRDGDRVTVPGYELSVTIAIAVPDPPDRTATVARKLLGEALARAGSEGAPPWLELTSGRRPGQRWTFAPAPARLVAGRGDGCDLFLDDPDCSRHHAEFVRDEQGVLVRDLASKNGVTVGARRVSERRLRDGDEVRFGRVTLLFRDPADALLRAFESGADDPSPVEPPRARTVPPPQPEAPESPSEPRPEESASPSTPTPAEPAASSDAATRSPSLSRPPSTASSSGRSVPARPRPALDWVVAALAMVILAVSVAALALILRPR